jgi:hypothetical protein
MQLQQFTFHLFDCLQKSLMFTYKGVEPQGHDLQSSSGQFPPQLKVKLRRAKASIISAIKIPKFFIC